MSALREFVQHVKETFASNHASPGVESFSKNVDGRTPPSKLKTPKARVLVGVRISPEKVTLLIGGEQQFSAMAEYSDGSTEDITDQVVWSSRPDNIVTVDAKGVATGLPENVEAKTVTITATATDANKNRFAGLVTITVTPGDHQERLRLGMIDVDLSQLRTDLASTSPHVWAAIRAEKTMKDVASRAGLDLDKPEAALACMKNKLNDQDKINLKNGSIGLEQERVAVVNILHQMQITVDQLQSARESLRPEKLPAKFFDDLDKDLRDAGTTVEHIWDFFNGISAATDWMSLIHSVAGSDEVKDHIKSLGDEVANLNDKLAQVGETLNNLIAALDEQNAQAISNHIVALQRERDDWDKAIAVYVKELNSYRQLFSKLSAKAGCPPGVSQTYMAVVAAGQLSQNARSALITKTLEPNKYQEQVKQLVPPGALIWNAPAGDKSVVNSYLVYEKSGKQYRYLETIASLKKLLQQLLRVKQVYDAASLMDKRFNKWNDALSN